MTTLPDHTLCGCGARLTSEVKWSEHVKAGCTLAGRPRRVCEQAAAEREVTA